MDDATKERLRRKSLFSTGNWGIIFHHATQTVGDQREWLDVPLPASVTDDDPPIYVDNCYLAMQVFKCRGLPQSEIDSWLEAILGQD